MASDTRLSCIHKREGHPDASSTNRSPAVTDGAMSRRARTSVVDFDARQRERLAVLAEQTTLHANTGEEVHEIGKVIDAVRSGVLPVTEAHAVLAELRRQQVLAA